MTYNVVCFSHVTAAGGETIAKRVAQTLGFRYVDDEVVIRAATSAGLDPDALASVEHHKSLFTRLMEALATPPKEVEGYLGLSGRDYYSPEAAPSAPSFEEGRRLIQEALIEIAGQGRVVIVAHAASMALAQRADVLRVHVTASEATRLRHLRINTRLISEDEHVKSIAEADRQRQKYLQKFYGIAAELPTHYDLVINTDALEPDRAAAAVLAIVGR